MGGCRCTYRNCTVRSDGKTHLFHYPVMDKLRCHQWLTNAQRLEFLRLRVSQLKNRVVCQNHFTDDMFMNFKKDKLKHFAVPTENGPFCDSSNFDQDENHILSPIKVEYIDNENRNNIDKKKAFSKKYGDFLTNCEVMEEVEYIDKETMNNIDKKKVISKKQGNFLVNCEVMEVKAEFDKDFIAKSKEKATNNVKQLANSKLLGTKVRTIKLLTPEDFPKHSSELIQNQNVTSSSSINSNINPNKNRVKIISEKKITEPLAILSPMIPVPPFYVLQKPQITNSFQENLKQQEETVQVENELEEMFKSPEVINFQIRTDTGQLVFDNQSAESFSGQQSEQIIFQNSEPKENASIKQVDPLVNKPKSPTPTKSLLKNSTQRVISHQRIAAIEEKRKFNMKLRDIINDSLNKLDEQVQDVSDKVKSNIGVQNQNVTSLEVEMEPNLPDTQKYFMELLDKRMKKMEETLLNRIDMNSQHIKQLKNTVNRPEKTKRMSVYTQTNLDEEAHKKSIYNELSQYLSSEAKSKVYEELFLNSVKRPRTSKRPNRILYASK